MRGFYSRKIHSLLGIIPLGGFFLEHMLTNFAAVEGGASGFTDSVLWLNSLPLVFLWNCSAYGCRCCTTGFMGYTSPISPSQT